MAGGLGPAYNQTDNWNSPEWLRATAQGHGRQARLARERLKELHDDEGRRQQARQFAAAHSQSAREFAARENERIDLAGERARERQDYQAGLSAERESRNAILKQNADTQRLTTLQYMLSDPNFKDQHEGIKAEIARMTGIGGQGTMPITNPNAKKGAYGPGDAPQGAAPQTGGAQGTAAYAPPTAAFSGGPIERAKAMDAEAAANSGPYVGPQELSPPPGSSPDKHERAAVLRGMVARGEANTGFVPTSPLDNRATGGLSPVNRYDPATKANIATTGYGEDVVVGAGDPSVGALDRPGYSYSKDIHGKTMLQSPDGGSMFVTAGQVANHPNWMDAAKGPNPAPVEHDMGGNVYTPPTAAFTQPAAAAPTQPAFNPAQYPAPVGPPTAGAPIQFGMQGQPPIDIGSIGINPLVPSNQAEDERQRRARGAQPQPFRF